MLLAVLFFVAACAPSPAGNVIGYLVQRWQQEQVTRLSPPAGIHAVDTAPETGSLIGEVRYGGMPAAGISVLVAARDGQPYTARTDAAGHYRIDGVPPGQYVPAAVGPGFDEAALAGVWGLPWPVTVAAGETVEVPPLYLTGHEPAPLPAPLPQAVRLTAGSVYTATAPFPPDSVAEVHLFQFERAGAVVDSLRVYRPLGIAPTESYPLLFVVYPGVIEGWEPVSVAFAGQGLVLVAISPTGARGLDIEAHTLDARVALHLARGGYLGVDFDPEGAIALGGSFSSAILHRLLREEPGQFAAWVNVGGISNAFRGAADFYAGKLDIPPKYATMIPALGPANVYPLAFLRYSPVYTAAELPPTMLIHTDIDHIIPIDQAYELEAALRAAHVPVEVFYYRDVSHYLQIGEDITPEGMEMFYRVLDFIQRHSAQRRR